MKTVFYDPLVVKEDIAKMDIEVLREQIINMITPREHEWIDDKTHFRVAAHEVLRLLFKHK